VPNRGSTESTGLLEAALAAKATAESTRSKTHRITVIFQVLSPALSDVIMRSFRLPDELTRVLTNRRSGHDGGRKTTAFQMTITGSYGAAGWRSMPMLPLSVSFHTLLGNLVALFAYLLACHPSRPASRPNSIVQ